MIDSSLPTATQAPPRARSDYQAPGFGAQLGSVLGFELLYRFKRPATYIYFAICLGIGLLIGLTDVVRLVGGFGKVNANAPFITGIWITQLGTILGFFLFSAIMSVPVYRDYEHSVYSFLFSYPIRKQPYLMGRFFGSLIIAFGVIAGLPIGMLIAEQITVTGNTTALNVAYVIMSGTFSFALIGRYLNGVIRANENGQNSRLGALVGNTNLYIGFILTGIVSLILAFAFGESNASKEVLENYGPFSLAAYIQPMLTMVLPNLLFLGAIYFTLPTLTRNIFITYVLGISVLVLYALSAQLLQQLIDSGNRNVATLLDPFGFGAFSYVTEYWTVAQKNNQLVPLEGWLLYNRLLWGGLGLLVFGWCLARFKFSVSGVGGKRLKDEATIDLEPALRLPHPTLNFNLGTRWRQFTSTFKVELQSTVRNVFFIVFLVAIGLYVAMDAAFADQIYGTGVHPRTSVMMQIEGFTFQLLLLVLLTFLAGEVVWRERQLKLDQVYDALPVPKASTFFAKLISLWVVPVAFLALVILIGITVQTFKGHFEYEIGLYLYQMFIVRLPYYLLIASMAFIAQVVVNNKFAGHGAMVLFFLSGLALNRLGLEHPLWDFASGLGLPYSDMDGYGAAALRHNWYLLHWWLVVLLLLGVAYGLYVHGTEGGAAARTKEFGRRFRTSRVLQGAILGSLVACLGTGYWIWYNTTQLDSYRTEKEGEKLQVWYEKKFKRLERAPQPRITKVYLETDLYPEDLKLDVRGTYQLRNKTKLPVDTIWVNWPTSQKNYTATWNRAATAVVMDSLGDGDWMAYALAQPLQPGDSIELKFTASFGRRGFRNASNVRGNGTFFNNGNVAPSIGYQAQAELRDDDKRREYGLAITPPLPPASDSFAVNTLLFTQDADWIDFESVISTSEDQIAVAPGYLQRKWVDKGRAYYHYKMDQPIMNFYNVVSARYTVTRDTHNGINIEIYHIPQHSYNVQKMIASVKASLDYYGRAFAPYQHKQVRILEFPNTAGTFAQSFANTIPYSEGIGFIAKLGDPEDVDYVYYVTAHEMAHQWWAHQAAPAAVRGGQFISETLSQYSAMMVLKEQYGLAPMRKYLRYELNRYLTGRSGETKKENTLMEVEFQDYIYYRKGSVVMFALADYLGEENYNKALANFLRPVRLQGPPFPIMTGWYDSVRALTPDTLRPFLEDQMQKITLYDNRVVEARGKVLGEEKLKNSKGKDSTIYDTEVTLKVLAGQFYADSLGAMPDKPSPLSFPVDVALLTAQNPTKAEQLLFIEKRRIPRTDTTVVTVRFKGKKPVYAGVDPIHKLVDQNVQDNLTQIEWDTPPAKAKPAADKPKASASRR